MLRGLASPQRSAHLIKVVPDQVNCPILEQRSIMADSPLKRKRIQQQRHSKSFYSPHKTITKLSTGSKTGLILPRRDSSGSPQQRGGTRGTIHQGEASCRSKTSAEHRPIAFSEENMSPAVDLLNKLENNLQELIDQQIELDDRQKVKKRRA